MELHYLGKPTIPLKDGYYIVRGHLTCGGMHKNPKFVADFYVEKKSYTLSSPLTTRDKLTPAVLFQDLFFKSVRRYKKETDAEFVSRCRNKWGQHYLYFHYKDADWRLHFPVREVA